MLPKSPTNKNDKICPEVTSTQRKELAIWNPVGCGHMNLDSLFIKMEGGCIRKCVDCKLIFIKHCPCATEQNTDASEMLPCIQHPK